MIRAAAMVLLLALAACSNRPGFALSQRTDDAPRVRDPGYYDELERFTRYSSHYDGLDHRFYFAATWESWAFRQRKVAATADFLYLPADEAEALLVRESAEAGEFVDFFVGFYTAESRWNNLSAPDTIWRIELVLDDGTGLLPISIERPGRPNANTTALYPYLTPFWTAYRIRFPTIDTRGERVVRPGGELRLRLGSAVGAAVSNWSITSADLP